MKKHFVPMVFLFVAVFASSAFAAETEIPVGADIVESILGYLPDSWGGWITLAVTACAAIAAVWSRPSDDANIVIRVLYALVNAIGFNAGKAQNADDAAAKSGK